MDGSQPINPYLAGNFAPVRSEDDFELAVTAGELPKGLAGALYRNGPNPAFEPKDPNHHWFVGDGMIHGFFIEDGRAHYRNRYVKTPKLELEREHGRSLFAGFNPLLSDPVAMGKDNGVANTNIVHHAGKLLALEEAHEPFELDAASLDSKGYLATGGKFTAHPKMDPETGEMVWFAYSAGEAPLNAQVDYGVTDAAGNVTRRDRFEAPYCSMIHDFLVTRSHVLFPVLPLVGSLQRVMTGGPAFAWEPEKGAFVGVMRRDASVDTLRWFEVPACYVFHPMNAWEDGQLIHADVMEYPTAPLFPNADGSRGLDSRAVLVRWTFDLASNSNQVRRQVLDDTWGEFPRFDERKAGLAYAHGWFASRSPRPDAMQFDGLAHWDVAKGRRADYRFTAGDTPGEPIFVPRTADAAEGDGWLLSVVYRSGEDRSDLTVFEAQDITSGPIAVAALPRRVPFGFHGNWVGA